MALEDDRLQLLFEQFCSDRKREFGAYGSQTFVAEAFGVDKSTINKFVNQTRGAGEELRDKVAAKLRLDPQWFKVADLGKRLRYTDWIRQPTREERDVFEAPTITKYLKDNPHHERFRTELRTSLNASSGDVKLRMVIAAVRALEDEERERQ